MTKKEFFEALKDVPDDTEMLVLDIFYDETVCYDVIKWVVCHPEHIDIEENSVRLGSF